MKNILLFKFSRTLCLHTLFLPTLTLLIAAIFFSLQLITISAAQEKPADKSEQYGPWSIICETPPGAPSEQCALMQNVVAADRKEVGLSVIILKTADKKQRILRVLAPLGVLLTNGLGLNIDGENMGRTAFVRCVQDGCYAEVVLEGQILDAFQKGQNAVFIIFQTPEEGIGIPVDLSGFSKGFKNLP